ncbi:lipopolysaccharide biosynthesis protein [Paenibacillus apiarius]|uniref:lipopolysaccharide biosynthesis protein n=1 Tax=Paenibacillus apiarius TaxID=46240 RepID=UPI003B3B4891
MALSKSKLFKNAAVLMSGTALSQGIAIAAAPLLSRLYTPEQFGVFSIYTAFVSLFSVTACWKYEMSIVVPEREKDSVNLVNVSMTALLLTTLGTGLLMLIIGPYIGHWFGVPRMDAVWTVWLPLTVFSIGGYQCFSYWCTRNKKYKRQSISQIFRSTGVTGMQLTGGVTGLGSIGLVLGQFAGQMLASGVLFFQVWKEDKAKFITETNVAAMKEQARKFKQYPLYNMPQTIVNSVAQNMTPFLLAVFFGPAVVGLYGLSLRMLQLPIYVISESVRNVYFQQASELHNQGMPLFGLLKKTTLALIGAGIVPVLATVAFAPQLFAFALGGMWYEAGEYARWMVCWWFVNFFMPPAFVTGQLFNLQKHLLVYEIFSLLLRVAALFSGYAFNSPLLSIALYSLVGVVMNLGLVASMLIVARKRSLLIEKGREEGNGIESAEKRVDSNSVV